MTIIIGAAFQVGQNRRRSIDIAIPHALDSIDRRKNQTSSVLVAVAMKTSDMLATFSLGYA